MSCPPNNKRIERSLNNQAILEIENKVNSKV